MAKPATSCFKKETTTLHGAELHRHGVGQMGEGFGNVPRAYPLCSGDRDRERDLPMMTTVERTDTAPFTQTKRGGGKDDSPVVFPLRQLCNVCSTNLYWCKRSSLPHCFVKVLWSRKKEKVKKNWPNLQLYHDFKRQPSHRLNVT